MVIVLRKKKKKETAILTEMNSILLMFLLYIKLTNQWADENDTLLSFMTR